MSIGICVINAHEEVRVIRKELLRYGREDNRDPAWYPAGKVGLNDLILSIASGTCLQLKLWCWGNRDMLPLEKTLEKGLCDFQTVFAGYFVSLHRHAEGLTVKIGEQQKQFLPAEKEILLLVRDGRIVYFTPNHGEGMACNQKVIAGEPFPAFIDETEAITLSAFFPEAIAASIRGLIKRGDQAYGNIGGDRVCLCLLDAGEIIAGCKIVSVGDENDYFALIRRDTAAYDKLYYENEMQLYENQLDNNARLKGFGKNILEVNQKLDKVCRKNVTIVLTGESGTGKTYIAKQIHQNSKRKDEPFVSVNCAAIAPNLIESELFGYDDGAFTGARRGGKPGFFEMASGGTLFLDEISELPLLLQGKLLEVLQEGTFYRVGGTRKISVDVRLIVATNKNLEKMVRDGLFREDLYYRIHVFPIHLPPLRERTEDMYSIIEDTLPSICRRLDIEVPIFTQETMQKIRSYGWPGNIRELENVLEKAAVMAENNLIRKEDVVIDNPVRGAVVSKTLREKMADYEKILLTEAYHRFEGNRKMMADYLGLSKTNLFEKIHKYGLDETGENK